MRRHARRFYPAALFARPRRQAVVPCQSASRANPTLVGLVDETVLSTSECSVAALGAPSVHSAAVPSIKAVVFDIGGILEISRDGREPTKPFKHVVARWESRLGLRSSELLNYLMSKREDGATGRCSYDEWLGGLRAVMRADQAEHDEFIRDFWNLYLGELNVELADWFRALRPRYRTALLSNSFIGAREREQNRYAFSKMTDLIVYSHEVGVEKPDRRIYEVTWQRLGIEPEEMVFLDDVEEYVVGGRSLGIQTVLYRDNAQAIAEIKALLDDRS